MELRVDKENREQKLIWDKIEAVKREGFGAVNILIRNGAIYRIQKMEDEIIEVKTG